MFPKIYFSNYVDYVVKSLVSIGFIIEIMRGGIWLGKTKQGLGQKVKREQNNHSEHNYICQLTLKMNLCKKTKEKQILCKYKKHEKWTSIQSESL